MKFIVSSGLLLKQLQAISGALSSNNPLPILENFLFDVSPKNLTIVASDLETTMIARLEVEAIESGKISIPSRILVDTLKTLPEQPLTFTIDENINTIEISSDFGKYKLSGHNGNEYPKIPVIEGGSNVAISASILSEAFNKTLFASGNDEMRPVMSGVFCQFSPENLTFVATDAHKLSRYRRMDATSSTAASFILPKKPLNLLKNILAGSGDELVSLQFNDSNASFSFGNIHMICRLIDGRYPNYEAVIPVENPNKMVVDRASFLNSIRRVSFFSSKTTNQVRLKIKGSELQISAEDLDFANEALERLSCQYDGQDMEIGFNARFLTDILSNLSSEEIRIEMSVPNRPGIIIPVNGDVLAEDILMLAMPVMLNN
jgi:DNA polymerase-3 subunit beta